jgi:hypothetical protein
LEDRRSRGSRELDKAYDRVSRNRDRQEEDDDLDRDDRRRR